MTHRTAAGRRIRSLGMAVLLALLFCPLLKAQDHPDRLFHISKSSNRNIICYDASFDQAGTLDKSKPVHVYWHNNEDRPGAEDELNLIQWKMAYGYKVNKHEGSSAVVSLKAYNKRSVTVCKEGGKWVALVSINGQEAQLKEIHVHTKPGNTTSVEYIILKGTVQGRNVEEKILK